MENTSELASLNPEDVVEFDMDDTESLDVADLEVKTDEGKERKGQLEEAIVHHKLGTPVQPIEADHSFSGISFQVEAKAGIAKYRIRSFWIQGHLGNVSVYVSNSRDKLGTLQEPRVEDYLEVANETFEPSWDEPVEIKIPEGKFPVIEAGCNRSFYIHSDWPDDQGIIYQSYRSPVIVQDDNIRMLPGYGHTSNVPFSLMDGYHGHGWWVPERGFTGTITYDEVYTIWNPDNHKSFPGSFQEAIMTLLLCNAYGSLAGGGKAPVTKLPADCLHHIFSYMHPLWFEEEEPSPEFSKAVLTWRPRPTRWMHWLNPGNYSGDDEEN